MTVFSNWLSMLRDDDGQGLAEYALILALIAIIAIAALIFLGGEIAAILSSIGAQTSPGIATASTTRRRPSAGVVSSCQRGHSARSRRCRAVIAGIRRGR